MTHKQSIRHHFDHTPFLVPANQTIRLGDYDPSYTAGVKNKTAARNALIEDVAQLAQAQAVLWASRQYALVIIFQAMDAAGKDGTIKHVMSGVNPQGVDVHSFKAPTDEERLHHFLWRATRVTPARGRIAIFNRSYYEEVLVVRVHPEFLDNQWLPHHLHDQPHDKVWQARFDDINTHERLWTRNNVIVLKFFLNVSKKEQKKRFLQRLYDPEKNWKFSAADIRERGHWDEYLQAFEAMLSATSTACAPWYVIPADKKWFSRAVVADIISSRIEQLDLRFPTVSDEDRAALAEAKRRLEAEDDT